MYYILLVLGVIHAHFEPYCLCNWPSNFTS